MVGRSALRSTAFPGTSRGLATSMVMGVTNWWRSIHHPAFTESCLPNGSSPAVGCNDQWGLEGDIPVWGRFADRNVWSVAVFRATNGTRYLPSTLGTCPVTFQNAGTVHDGLMACARQLGLAGDVPVVGDYDGDGLDDVAVYRPGHAWGSWCLPTVSVRRLYLRASSTRMGGRRAR